MKTNMNFYNLLKKEKHNSNKIHNIFFKNLKSKINFKNSALNNKLKLSYFNKNNFIKWITSQYKINIKNKYKKLNLNTLLSKITKNKLKFSKIQKKNSIIKKTNIYNSLIKKVYGKLKKKYKTYNDSYINNIHILYQDSFLNKFINILLLKKGKRHNAFKIFYKTLLIIKKITCISPIRVIKSLLRIERLIITYSIKRRGSKLIKIPKINSKKNLYLKYLFHIKKLLVTLQISKHYSISEKLAYIIIFNLLKLNKIWKSLISDNTKASQIYEHKRLLLYKKY